MLLSVASPALAASRYWIATSTANWNDTANWSTSSTGAGGSSVPRSSDIAYFTSNRLGSYNINANVNVLGLNFSGYIGTITQTSTYTITVGTSDWIQTSGTFSGGSGTIDVNDDFTLSGGTFTSTSGTFYVAGYWTHTSGGTFTHNSGTVTFDGGTSDTINVATSETFYNLTANKSGYTLTIASGDTLIVTNTLTLTNGYVNYSPTPGTLEARGDVSVGSEFDGGTAPLKFTGTTAIHNFSGYYINKFNGDITINKTAGEAKQILLANGSNYEEVTTTFLLFADPAMALKVPVPRRPTGLAAEVQAANISLTWQGATDCDGSAVTGYNLYRSATAGGAYSKVNSSLLTETSYEDTTCDAGTTYYYVARSMDADGLESVETLEVSATLPTPASSGGGGGGGCFIGTAGGQLPWGRAIVTSRCTECAQVYRR